MCCFLFQKTFRIEEHKLFSNLLNSFLQLFGFQVFLYLFILYLFLKKFNMSLFMLKNIDFILKLVDFF